MNNQNFDKKVEIRNQNSFEMLRITKKIELANQFPEYFTDEDRKELSKQRKDSLNHYYKKYIGDNVVQLF